MKTTVNDLTAAIEGFNIPIENSINIIDKWINVEKQFAVTSRDLAEATKTAGATANQLGISIDSFLGNVTAVIEVTRKSGSEAARGLTFIYARLLTTGKGVLEQIAKVPVYLDKQKKATFELTDTYRSASDVLDDLASKWDILTNKQRLDIATQIASKRQLTVFMALMQNYNAAISARIVSIASAGQAERAFGIIQETTAVKLQKLTSSWNSLTLAIGDTTSFKSAIEATISLLEHITALMNKKAAYENEGKKAIDRAEREKDATISQAKSLKELIELRDKYSNAPKTEINTEILNKINDAIKQIQESGTIKIDINSKDAQKQLDEFIESGEKAKIQTTVDIKYDVDKQILIDKIKNLEKELGRISITTVMNRPGLEKEHEEAIKALGELNKKRREDLNARLAEYEKQKVVQEATKILTDDELNITGELSAAEEEKLQIQERLNTAKNSGLFTARQLVDLEIELTKNAKFTLDTHAQNLQLAELEVEKRKAITDEYKKQRDSIRSQYVDYQKADMFERGRLRRLMELLKLSPSELGQAFESTTFDENLITDYFNTFSQEGQNAVNDIIQRLYDLPNIDIGKILGGTITSLNGTPTPIAPITNITGVSGMTINVDAGGMETAEEVVALIDKMMGETLLANDDFIQAFVKKIRPII
jgi:TP901 family phage tail tape measure protein